MRAITTVSLVLALVSPAVAVAAEPVQLGDTQLDRVTAGAVDYDFDRIGRSRAFALAIGRYVSAEADVEAVDGGIKATSSSSSCSNGPCSSSYDSSYSIISYRK